MVRIQFVSDLHIEFHNSAQTLEGIKSLAERVPVRAPYLALLGDIGVVAKGDAYKQYLLYQAQRFQKVFVVAGNHEYYHSSYEKVTQTIQEICDSHENLVFFNRKSIVLEEEEIIVNGKPSKKRVNLIGCTLWTNIPQECAYKLLVCMNDYSQITYNGGKLTPDITNKLHSEEVEFIDNELTRIRERSLAENTEEVSLVLTHMAPTLQFVYGQDPIMKYSEGDALEPLMEKHNSILKAWIYGHTHVTARIKLNGVWVLSNCLGYETLGDDDDLFDFNYEIDTLALDQIKEALPRSLQREVQEEPVRPGTSCQDQCGLS
eukprot:TRINITY_DN15518_c0_g1_i1.p1 TRINITY_DN15518_c0_g1~~TRINITY_DN15518_c0_g1_i1.p1  ORF type:complete len:318 (-),score=43.52 TRINITY_DN15518_c0_g1_i1:81-1034(-)